nr:hypothetical protein [Tanacetum cinerariifolium]
GVHDAVGQDVAHLRIEGVALRVAVLDAGQVVLLPYFQRALRAGEARNPDGLGIDNVAENAKRGLRSFLASGYRRVEATQQRFVGPHIENAELSNRVNHELVMSCELASMSWQARLIDQSYGWPRWLFRKHQRLTQGF